MTTDAEYRALAERLGALSRGAWTHHDKDADGDEIMIDRTNDMHRLASAILALLEERDGWRKIAERLAWLEPSLTLAESRLGKAVDLLQRTINGPAATHDEEWALFDETMAFLSDLEKSE